MFTNSIESIKDSRKKGGKFQEHLSNLSRTENSILTNAKHNASLELANT